MAANLQKIKPLHPQMVPPQGAEAIGVTPDGRQLYKLVTARSRSVLDIDEKTGEQKYRKNQQTGEPLYRMRKPEFYEKTEIFYQESEGNGNVRKIPYTPPTEAELAAAERTRKIAEMRDGLAEAFVDRGLTPAEAVAQLAGATPEHAVEYPFHLNGARWQLSNGEIATGKREDAEIAEKAVLEAKAVATATPDF